MHLFHAPERSKHFSFRTLTYRTRYDNASAVSPCLGTNGS